MTTQAGTTIPAWTMPDVDPNKMKTMAAILRDPYPVHWDRAAVEQIGRGRRVINQGPLNLSYITNMLMEWQGDDCIRRLQVSFADPVLDHQHVVATGTVVTVETVGGEQRATCQVQLERDGEAVVSGTAVIALREDQSTDEGT